MTSDDSWDGLQRTFFFPSTVELTSARDAVGGFNAGGGG